MKLGEAMVKDSLITKEQLRLALERQVIFGGRLGTNLVELGVIKEFELSEFLSKFNRVPAVDPQELISADKEIASSISIETVRKYNAIPFKMEKKRLHVAMLEPRSMAQVDELRFVIGVDIIPHVCSEIRFLYALEKLYGHARDLRYISIFGKEEEKGKKIDRDKKHILRIKTEFANAHNRDEVIGILLNESKSIVKRIGIFIVKGNTVTGWKSKGLSIENMNVEINMPSIFADVINRKHYYRGPLLNIPGNEPLIKALSGLPQDSIMLPIVIREKIIALLYADNGNVSVLDASLSHINNLVTMAAYSFELIILRNKLMAL
jgi:hypothetical protein